MPGFMDVMSGIGNIFDLPGSMVRDVAARKNPFDQIMSPFSDKNRTSGRDLLRQYGLASNKDTLGNFAGGWATEEAMDPLNYLTLGAVAGIKKVLKGAGEVKKLSNLKRAPSMI